MSTYDPTQILPVVFQDEDLMVVSRPAALPMRSPYRDVEAPLSGLMEALAHLNGGPVYEGARLGEGLGGLIILGRHPDAARAVKTATGRGALRWTARALAVGAVRPSGEGLRVVTRGRWEGSPAALVEASWSKGSIKVARAMLKSSGGARVAANPYGWRVSGVSGEHPVTGAPWSVSAPDDGGVGAALRGELDAEALVRAALGVRISCVLDEASDCFRVLGEDRDGVPGVVADRFGEVVLLHLREGLFEGQRHAAVALAEALATWSGASSVFLRRVAKGGRAEKLERTPLVGAECPDELVVREHGLKYLIRPHHGMSPGLFLDQRPNRRRVLEMSEGKRVLNTFAHTCGFSVAAAAGGASEVVSVDASKRYLAWGRENLALNGLSEDGHDFVATDVIDYCRRAGRRGQRFDLIILDPPTFGRDKRTRRDFSVTRDLETLLREAFSVLAPGGEVMLCVNHRGTSPKAMREAVSKAAGRRPWVLSDAPRLPPDYAGQPGFSKTLWLAFDKTQTSAQP